MSDLSWLPYSTSDLSVLSYVCDYFYCIYYRLLSISFESPTSELHSRMRFISPPRYLAGQAIPFFSRSYRRIILFGDFHFSTTPTKSPVDGYCAPFRRCSLIFMSTVSTSLSSHLYTISFYHIAIQFHHYKAIRADSAPSRILHHPSSYALFSWSLFSGRFH